MPLAMASQDLIPHLQLANTVGVLFIGVVLAAIFFGGTYAQAFIYFQTHNGTAITFYKIVVMSLCILDALHLALIVHCTYFYLVVNFANIPALTEIVWSCKLQLVVAFLTVFVDRLLYVYRIWTISDGRSRVLPIIISIAVLTSGPAIAIVWCTYQQVHLFADLINIAWALYTYCGAVAFVDILIVSSLCYLLIISRTGTDFFISTLVNYIINTGCLTSMCSMVAIITWAVMPKNLIFIAAEFLALKLHVHLAIALLNVGYYAQHNTDTMRSSEYHVRHDVYRPRLHVGASQDEEMQASHNNMFKHPGDEALHVARPDQAVTSQRLNEVAMEISLSSA
ncbi:uncharacterized protein EDB93DRAFT_1248975 [Suillus bovinus]|uniref:uncharacterized protein n=1 Tax=Suillus bovinus TaxID=48563 RepID=UPI001B874F3B|nr:uncharacterized protein EDB93DRAFT_1248975 [Suillus bovinus]KAG2153057.1 hypothetical protein EDB93DRAFT_1248975 [Suillus bovinus]